MFERSLFMLIILLSILSCNLADEEKIIGKWQCDRDWFLFKKDKTYSSGKDEIKMVDQFKYTLDEKRKELNMYTSDPNTTYYLIYEFIGNDTLAIRNSLSQNKTMINFIRVKN